MARSQPDAFSLKLETLHHFQDAVTEDFDAQLSGIVADCRKRPGCNKARTITLKLEAEPSEADPDDVIVRMVVSSKIPAAKHIDRLASASRTNQLQLKFDHSDDVISLKTNSGLRWVQDGPITERIPCLTFNHLCFHLVRRGGCGSIV